MGRNDSWPSSLQSLFGPRKTSGRSIWKWRSCVDRVEVSQGGLCSGVSTGSGAFSMSVARWRLSKLVSARRGPLVPGIYSEEALSGAPSYLLSCKISAKLDNPRPSYSNLTNYRWPPPAILYVEETYLDHFTHWRQHFLPIHQIW